MSVIRPDFSLYSGRTFVFIFIFIFFPFFFVYHPMQEGLRISALPQTPRADGCNLGAPTLTPTLTVGGSGINIVPGSASVSVDRRVVAGEVAATVQSGLEEFAQEVEDGGEGHSKCAYVYPCLFRFFCLFGFGYSVYCVVDYWFNFNLNVICSTGAFAPLEHFLHHRALIDMACSTAAYGQPRPVRAPTRNANSGIGRGFCTVQRLRSSRPVARMGRRRGASGYFWHQCWHRLQPCRALGGGVRSRVHRSGAQE